MKRMVLGIILLAMGAAMAVAGEIPKKVAADAIPNYQQLSAGLATAGQPSADTLAKLKSLGFKTVVNLRAHGEDPIVEKEGEVVTAQGLKYVSVPVTPKTLSISDVTAVRKILDDPAAAPVLLHCASANRVGAVWAAVEVSRGRALAEAEAEGKKIGLASPSMVEALHRVADEMSIAAGKAPAGNTRTE
jgi:uncharacterized protein (TIGR01244 family)